MRRLKCRLCKHTYLSFIKAKHASIKESPCPFCHYNKVCFDKKCTYCYAKSIESDENCKKHIVNKDKIDLRFVHVKSDQIFTFRCQKCLNEFDEAVRNVSRKNVILCKQCLK